MQTTEPQLNNARYMRQWLLSHYSRNIAKRTLTQFNACCNWAVFEDLLPWNPFTGLTRYLSQRRELADTFVAFTPAERAIIIAEFTQSHPRHAPWVVFLFLTGCRPEEAAALRWHHVSLDFGELAIKEAQPQDTGILQSTKNYRSTRFPVNAQLRPFLLELWERSTKDRHDFIFKSPKPGHNAPFNYNYFQQHYWKPLLERLVDEGRVAFYATQYNCRHTFISELVRKRDPKDVSYLCRVSVGTLMRVYCDRSREIDVPVLDS